MKYRLLVGYKTVLISAIIHGNKPQTNKLHPWPLATGRERASSKQQTNWSKPSKHERTSGHLGAAGAALWAMSECPECGSASLLLDSDSGCDVCRECGATYASAAQFETNAGGVSARRSSMVLAGDSARDAARRGLSDRKAYLWSTVEKRTHIVVVEWFRFKPLTAKSVVGYIRELSRGRPPAGEYVDVLIAACLFAAVRQDRDLGVLSLREISRELCEKSPKGVSARRVSSAFATRARRVFSALSRRLNLFSRAQHPRDFLDRALALVKQSDPPPDAPREARVRAWASRLLDLVCGDDFTEPIHVGRRAEPVACAVALVACQAAHINYPRERAASALSVSEHPIFNRAREIREGLADMASALPLGITRENIKSHLSYVLRELDVVLYVHKAKYNVQRVLQEFAVRSRGTAGRTGTTRDAPPPPLQSSEPPLPSFPPPRSAHGVIPRTATTTVPSQPDSDSSESDLDGYMRTEEEQKQVSRGLALQSRDNERYRAEQRKRRAQGEPPQRRFKIPRRFLDPSKGSDDR